MVKYLLKSSDEKVICGKSFYFTIVQVIESKDKSNCETKDIEFFINSVGLIFFVNPDDDKKSIVFGLRDFMNSEESFQKSMLSAYERFKILRNEMHKIDE